MYFRCIEGCSCLGLTINCRKENYITNDTDDTGLVIHASTRVLDLNGNPSLFRRIHGAIQSLPYLLHFNMSSCEVSDISQGFFDSMANLITLDISYNKIKRIHSRLFFEMKRLIELHLVGNLEVLVIEQEAFSGLDSIRDLYLARAVIDIADIDVSIKISFDIHIDTEKGHIDIEKWYMYIV